MIGKQRESKIGSGLYEQVLTKNFEIIQTFLSQFSQIFLKQDQFQATLNKIQHRLALNEKNYKKIDENLSRSTQMQDNKMKSLKQFILEKLKNSGQKIHSLTMKMITEQNNQQSNQQDKQILAQYQKHLCEQKKMQQNVNQNIKRLQWQIHNVNQKINSLTILTNSFEERIQQFTKFHRERNLGIITIRQLQQKIQINAEQIHKRITQNIIQTKNKFNQLTNKVQTRIPNLIQSLQQISNDLNQRITNTTFNQFKQTYKNDQECLIKQINQCFATKKQTKKTTVILQKRISKFQLIQEMLKQNQFKQSSATSGMSTPNTINRRTNYTSIHSVYPHKIIKQKQSSPSTAISVRRLSCKKYATKIL